MGKLHAGLDVSDQTTAICVLGERGGIVLETSVPTTPSAIAKALQPYKRKLANVGQETGTKAVWLHKELARRRFPMVCLDARHAKRALAARRNKSDRTDARGLATLLGRGIYTTAYVKTDEAIETRLLLTMRKTLQRKALDLQGSLRMSLKTVGGTVEERRRKVTGTNTKRPTPHIIHQLSAALLRSSEQLLAEVAVLDRLIQAKAKADPICRRLMTIPGVGPLTALTFRAAVDDPSRFKSSRDVAAHFGLTPRRFQSGQVDFSGHITRLGDPSVRAVLYSAASALINTSRSTSALRTWALQLVERKGFKLAAVACARKLAVLMHSMWVSGREFDPAMSAS